VLYKNWLSQTFPGLIHGFPISTFSTLRRYLLV